MADSKDGCDFKNVGWFLFEKIYAMLPRFAVS